MQMTPENSALTQPFRNPLASNYRISAPGWIIFSILALASLSCSLPFIATPQPDSEDAVPFTENVKPPVLPTTRETTQKHETGVESNLLIRQGASRSLIDIYEIEDVAIGLYVKRDTCGESYLAELPDDFGEIILKLNYPAALLVEQIDIYTSGQAPGIRHIEIFNSRSGLGRLAYERGHPIERHPLTDGPCSERLSIPVQSDIEADTIFISFENPAAVAQLGAVEMLGKFEAYPETPVP